MVKGGNQCVKRIYGGLLNTLRYVFIAFEVLEHIKEEVELLNMLSTKSRVLFSVPSFKSFNHIRTFKLLQSIQK